MVCSETVGEQTVQTQKHNTVTGIEVRTVLCSYVLWEREGLLIMQRQHKLRRLAGCVKVKQKMQYKTRYRKQQLVNTARLNREGLMTGDG